MSNIKSFPGSMALEQHKVLRSLDETIGAAVQEAFDAGVYEGLIVAMLHGHALAATMEMMRDDE